MNQGEHIGVLMSDGISWCEAIVISCAMPQGIDAFAVYSLDEPLGANGEMGLMLRHADHNITWRYWGSTVIPDNSR